MNEVLSKSRLHSAAGSVERRGSRGRTRTLSSMLLASVLALGGCTGGGDSTSNEDGSGPAPSNAVDRTTKPNDGAKKDTATVKRAAPPACPAIKPEVLPGGGLVAHATAPDAETFSTDHYFGVMTTMPGRYSMGRIAWYAPYQSDGTAGITIPASVMARIQASDGNGISTVSVWSDVEPPAAALKPAGHHDSAGVDDLALKAAQEKGINGDNLAKRRHELPRYAMCSNADWSVDGPRGTGNGTWITYSTDGHGTEIELDHPFAPISAD